MLEKEARKGEEKEFFYPLIWKQRGSEEEQCFMYLTRLSEGNITPRSSLVMRALGMLVTRPP